ncbi:MAG: hypothetical protein ACRDRO_19715 [Pseudonocardiaceae bacterium]
MLRIVSGPAAVHHGDLDQKRGMRGRKDQRPCAISIVFRGFVRESGPWNITMRDKPLGHARNIFQYEIEHVADLEFGGVTVFG